MHKIILFSMPLIYIIHYNESTLVLSNLIPVFFVLFLAIASRNVIST